MSARCGREAGDIGITGETSRLDSLTRLLSSWRSRVRAKLLRFGASLFKQSMGVSISTTDVRDSHVKTGHVPPALWEKLLAGWIVVDRTRPVALRAVALSALRLVGPAAAGPILTCLSWSTAGCVRLELVKTGTGRVRCDQEDRASRILNLQRRRTS